MEVTDLQYQNTDPVNFPRPSSIKNISATGLKGLRELVSAPSKNTTDNWWPLKNTRVVKAWQTARTKAEGIRIALPGAPVTPHSELEDNAVLSDLALTISPVSTGQVQGDQVAAATALASVIVSRQIGEIAGTAPAASVLPINCLSEKGAVEADALAIAINEAVTNKCQIICIAHCGGSSENLIRAIDDAVAQNVLVFCSSGDLRQPAMDMALLEGAICVAGSTAADELWEETSTGDHVDFAAPAKGVWGAVADHDAEVAKNDGTAFAVGITAGIAALWLGHHGPENLAKLAQTNSMNMQTLFKKAVLATSRQPNGWDSANAGCGIIDADALVRLNLDFVTRS